MMTAGKMTFSLVHHHKPTMMRVKTMIEMKRVLWWKPPLLVKLKGVEETICSLDDGKLLFECRGFDEKANHLSMNILHYYS